LDEITQKFQNTLKERISENERLSFNALRGNPKLFLTSVNEM